MRHLGDTGRVEIGLSELDRLQDAGLRAAVEEAVRGAGYARAVVDPAGYRPPALRVLAPSEHSDV